MVSMVAGVSRAIFAVGLPHSPESLRDQARAGTPLRVVDMLLRERNQTAKELWTSFYEKQVHLMNRAGECAQQAGFEVVYELRHRDFRGFTGSNLVVLVTHVDKGHMEFFDEMVTMERLLSIIHEDFHGVADFVGCQSDTMVDELKFHRSRANFMMTPVRYNLDEQLFVFRKTLEFMQTFDVGYLEAKMRLRTELLKRLRRQARNKR